ncbi:MAG: PAS domain S-box protein [Deltaproteobacteria bacterium]|nr:PAS domain S-box protein [Deltaproteobacteria bacterium]MBW2660604.1 PAS domain S-box protein [Deltaproteobacteria bacterium]
MFRWISLQGFISGSLRTKIILGVSLILTTALGAFGYLEVVSQIERYTKENKKMAMELSDTVMKSIEYPMLDGEMEQVQAILERLGTLEDLVLVHLCDDLGMIKRNGLDRYDIDRKTVSKITLKGFSTGKLAQGMERYSHNNLKDAKILRYAIPIYNEKACYKCHGDKKSLLGVLSVGVSWEPIQKALVSVRNQNIILTVISLTVVAFFLTLWLNRYIVRPIVRLTHAADEISRGKYVLDHEKFRGRSVQCWNQLNCEKTDCPAYENDTMPCWYVPDTLCFGEPSGKFPKKLDQCVKCYVYQNYKGDEIVRLRDSFRHMVYKLISYEEDLRASEKKYRHLFNADPNPIFIVDYKTFMIIDVNKTAMNWYGYSMEEFLGMSFFELSNQVEEDISAGFVSIKEDQHLIYAKRNYHKKTRGQYYVDIHVCPAKYKERNALIITTIDVTERVEKDAQLIQASKMSALGTMASGIAHELNQPLNVIKVGSDFFIKMIDRRKIDPQSFRTMAEEISSYVDKASGIINHMRNFTRTSNVKSAEININNPISDVFTMLGQQLILRQIDVKMDLSEDLPLILADHNRLEQVFINLVTNARDVLQEKERALEKVLKVKTFVENKQVKAIISDNGAGIPKENIEKIFEPFFTTKEVGTGTGLGLSISYGIVNDYGGKITVKSKVDEGTSFEVSFPAIT